MKASCPKCGSAAKFVSQTPRTIDFSEALFKCENPKCGGDVLAEVHFSMRKAAVEQCFSASASNPSQSVQIATDC